MSTEQSKTELLAGVNAYKGMLTASGHDVDKMVAQSLAELRQLQAERGLSNQQIRELNARALRKLIYGTAAMTPKERTALKKVFARLAEIFA